MDHDPTTIDELKKGSQFHKPQNMINGMEDSSDLYSRGYYANREILEKAE